VSTTSVDLGYNGLTEYTRVCWRTPTSIRVSMSGNCSAFGTATGCHVGRSSDIARARAFRTSELGDQKLLLVRDDQGALRGFTIPAGIAARTMP
jgi:hypothetical protein